MAPALLYDVGEPETALPTVTALRAARLPLSKEEEHTPEEHTLLERLRLADPAIVQILHVTNVFYQMLRARQGEQVEAWIAQAKDSDIPELRAFANSPSKTWSQ